MPFVIKNAALQKEFGTLSKVDARKSLQALTEHFSVDKSIDKKFLWIHSLQTHAPVRFMEDGKFSFELTVNDIKGEITDALNMLSRIVKKLQALGVYDNSLIIILSDHGFPTIRKLTAISTEQLYLGTPLGPFGPAAGQYEPTLMVKPPNAHGQVGYRDTAITLLDFRKTLNEFAIPGSGEPFGGVNFLDFNENVKNRIVPVLILKGSFGPNDFNITDNWETSNLRLPLYDNYKPDVGKQLKDLQSLKTALENYYAEHHTYPISQGFDGLYTSWGRSGEDWIQGLVPDYLPELPRDPRKNENPSTQYIYKSNGKDYKLISHAAEGVNLVTKIHPGLIDPRRDHSYGYWTEGARDW